MFQDIKESLRKIELNNNKLRWFGILLAVLFLYFVIFRNSPGVFHDVLAVAAAVILSVSLFAPRVLKPVWMSAMMLTLPIGWIVFRVTLIVCFYLVITPIGLGMRLFGNDSLRGKREKVTYWEVFEENKFPDKIRL